MRSLRWIALFLVAGFCAATEQPPYLIADFDGDSPLAGWNATGGTLALGFGHHGKGAQLHYSPGGIAEAVWGPEQPLAKRRDLCISMWIRLPDTAEVVLTAADSSGHRATVPVISALEPAGRDGWRYVVVPVPLKGRLTEAGLRVQPRVRSGVAEFVGFDEVMLRDLSEPLRLDSATELSPAEPPGLLGVNIHVLRDDPSLDLARAAGFSFVRMDLLWADVERGGRFRFGAYDLLLRALEARGMSALWILDYGHPDHGGKVPRSFADVAAFARFAGAAADHFRGRNVAFEIWNEPDTAQFWSPAPSPSEYAMLLDSALAAMRQADPAARISSGGVSRMDAPFLSRAIDPQAAAGLNAIAFHPYPQGGPETIADALNLFREWVAGALGKHLEVWDTEWGYSSANAPVDAPSNGHSEGGRKRQACLAVRELLTVWATGLPRAVYYDLRDDGADGSDPEHNYGLLDSGGKEKPAMRAIRTLTTAVRGRKFLGMARPTPPGIHAMRFDGDGDSLWIVWTDELKHRRKVLIGKSEIRAAVDLSGRALKWKESGGLAEVDIDETAGPVYITVPLSRGFE